MLIRQKDTPSCKHILEWGLVETHIVAMNTNKYASHSTKNILLFYHFDWLYSNINIIILFLPSVSTPRFDKAVPIALHIPDPCDQTFKTTTSS